MILQNDPIHPGIISRLKPFYTNSLWGKISKWNTFFPIYASSAKANGGKCLSCYEI